jgi:hypothetical protein
MYVGLCVAKTEGNKSVKNEVIGMDTIKVINDGMASIVQDRSQSLTLCIMVSYVLQHSIALEEQAA